MTESHNVAIERFTRRFALGRRTLSVTIDPMLDETVRDLILRATAINGLLLPSHVFALIAKNADGIGAAESQNRKGVIDTLGLPFDADLPLCDASGRKGYLRFFRGEIRASLLTAHRRVSPRALKVALYQRAHWGLKPFSFDFGTREMLMDTCPVCNERFRYNFTIGIEYCGACARRGRQYGAHRVDLRDFPQPLVEVEDVEALEYVISLFHLMLDPREGSFRVSHDELKHLSPSQLFELVVVLATSMKIFGNVAGTIKKQPEFRSNQQALPPAALAEAGRMLIDWPRTFIEFVSHVRELKGLRNHPLYSVFPRRAIDPSLGDAVHRHIRAERAGTIVETALKQTSKHVMAPERSRDLQSELSRLTRRGPRGELSLLGTLDLRGSGIGEDQVRLIALANKQGMSRLLSALGVPLVSLGELVAQKLLPADVLSLDYEPERLESLAVPLRDVVRRSASRGTPPSGSVSVNSIVSALCLGFRPPWAFLVDAATRGEFEFWIVESRTHSLTRTFYVRDVDAVRRLLSLAPPSDSSLAQLHVTTLDASLLMGLSKAEMWHYFKYGHLPVAPSLFQIRDHRRRFIRIRELVPRLRINGISRSTQVLSRYLRDVGIVQTAGGDGLVLRDRAAVEKFFGWRLWPCFEDPRYEDSRIEARTQT